MVALGPADWDAIRLSAKVAATATLASLPFGIVVAHVMSSLTFRGKTLLEAVLNLPLTLPPVVIGYLLLLLLGRKGWIGGVLDAAGIRIVFTWYAAVIASAVVGFPLLVRSIRIAMASIDQRLIQASRTLGARRYDALITVILPLSMRGILAGSALMFGRSLGEFGATIIVAGNIPGVTQTIPLAVYDHAGSPGGEGAALALCVVSASLSLLILFLHEHFEKRAAKRP